MLNEIWRVYNNCLVPNVAASDVPNIDINILRNVIISKKCLLARWTSNWDCGYKTEWWECIRDTPISLNTLTSKQRYRINRGLKNVLIRKIDPVEYYKELYQVRHESWKEYSASYRPLEENVDNFKTSLINSKWSWFGAFNSDNIMYAYAAVNEIRPIRNGERSVADLVVLKTNSQYLNTDCNAALVYFIVEYYLNKQGFRYITDGMRNIRHKTNFQEFLVHNLGFRYAYCKLNILYRKDIELLIKCLFPIRRPIQKISQLLPSKMKRLMYNLVSLLNQEHMRRLCKDL